MVFPDVGLISLEMKSHIGMAAGSVPPVLVPIPASVVAPRHWIAAVAAVAQHEPFGSCWRRRRRKAFEMETSSSRPRPRRSHAWGSVAAFRCRHGRTPGRASPANETARSPGAVRVRPRVLVVGRRRPHRGWSSSSSWVVIVLVVAARHRRPIGLR